MTHLEGRIIKHYLAMDVCFLVDWTAGDVVTGAWINMGFVNSFLIHERSTFKIKNLSDWLVCEEPINGCLRYETWKRLGN